MRVEVGGDLVDLEEPWWYGTYGFLSFVDMLACWKLPPGVVAWQGRIYIIPDQDHFRSL